MADFTVTDADFVAVPTPGACKMQVHDAPVYVTFTAAGTSTRGHQLVPGDIIPIGASDALRARRDGLYAATLVFEVFG